MKGSNFIQYFLIVLSQYYCGYGFPDGPGWHACVNLTPNPIIHKSPQKSNSPYEFVLSSASYLANTPEITVTIQRKDNQGIGLKGFIVAGFDKNDKPVGNFLETAESQPMCNFGSHAGHKNRNVKNSINLRWIPPSSPVGEIVFRGTLLQNLVTFWQSVSSSPLTGPGNPIPQNFPILGATQFNVDLSQCGKEKGCVRIPSNCTSEANCFGVVTWTEANDFIEFDLSVKGNYRSIAVGFSKDKVMEDDSIFGCYVDNYFSNFTARNYYSPSNPSKNNFGKIVVEKPIDGSVILEEASFNANEKLRCKVKRKKFIAGQEAQFFDIGKGKLYHIMVAFSDYSVDWPRYDGLYYHFITKSLSENQIDMTTNADLKLDFIIPPPNLTPTQPSKNDRKSKISLDDCGSEKSCFRVPAKCNPDSTCDYVVTWKKNNNEYEFEILGSPAFRYVAFALSNDKIMGKDSVLVCCLTENAPPEVANYYIDEVQTAPSKIGADGITVIETSHKDNEGIYCKFTRKIEVNNNDKIYPMTDGKLYNLFLAAGLRDRTNLQYHAKNRVLTDKQVSMDEITDIGGEPKSDKLMKAHGILMAGAWVLFAVFGIFNARYFKTLYTKKINNQDLWFILHRTGMIIGVLATISGFVLILVDLDGKLIEKTKKLHNAHPIIGIVVLILTLINPIMAAFRPHPGTKRRPIFNFSHRFVGLSALILGIINVIIGLRLERVGLVENDLWVSWVALGFFCFIILLGLILDFVPFCVTDEEVKKSNVYSLETIGQEPMKSSQKPHLARFIKAFSLILLVLASLTMTIIIIVKVA